MIGLRRVVRRVLAATVLITSALLGVLGAGSAAAQTQTAVEYYYAAWNFYFETSFPAEIAALDGGAFGGAWKRTGQTFSVWSQPTGGASPTCRFFSTALFAPKSSHFYTPFPVECAYVETNPADVAAWQFENIAFYIQLADANGMCGGGAIPLYRAFNNGMGGAPNHRYTTSLTILNQMIAAGWTFEGDGNTKVFACVPPSTVASTAEGLWYGTTNTGANIYGIILDTGVYYVIYTPPGTNVIAGVVQGTLASSNGNFSSSDARDFYISHGVFTAMVTGSYNPRTTIAGLISEGGGSESFSALYQSQYDLPVNLLAVAGTFSGQVASSQGWQSATITLDGAGNLSGSSNGCVFFGAASPHGAVNILDVTVTFNGAPCIFGISTLSGVAYYDAANKLIYGAAPNASRTDGFLFVGNKP